MKRPNAEDLRLAADWCESYEPGEDATELGGVVKWLRWQADQEDLATLVKRIRSEVPNVPHSAALKRAKELLADTSPPPAEGRGEP